LRVLIQPEDGASPILAAVKGAKKSIDIVIFRLDRNEIEAAIEAAARRGVGVRALVAAVNRGGEEQLRRLETRLLESGITVARTADDLVRYHAKMLLIDKQVLYVLSHNYTTLDIEHSRAFGIVTRNRAFVQEAIRLFEADVQRHPYTPEHSAFVVSPLNARKQLSEFIRKVRKELLIYDPKVSDAQMVKILQERHKAGVDIKIIGRLGKRAAGLTAQRLEKIRLHTRTIIRDRKQAFVGSQSLRKLELDSRRELGLIVKDPAVVNQLVATFERDWESRETPYQPSDLNDARTQKRIAKVTKKLDPLNNVIKRAVKKAVVEIGTPILKDARAKETLKQIVKKSVKQAVKEAVEEAAS
jgi:phosphatidylserine/phosphatidylglycerophosphate/cardiolipin synthase-like enzyme